MGSYSAVAFKVDFFRETYAEPRDDRGSRSRSRASKYHPKTAQQNQTVEITRLKANEDCKVDEQTLKAIGRAVKAPKKMSLLFGEAFIGCFTCCSKKKTHQLRLQDRILQNKQ